jgi:butyryl-CoA dehydrogenase
MNFALTDQQIAIRDTFARFSDERIAPQAAALDEAHAFPRELSQELADLGSSACATLKTSGTGMALSDSASRSPKSRAAPCRLPRPSPCSR